MRWPCPFLPLSIKSVLPFGMIRSAESACSTSMLYMRRVWAAAGSAKTISVRTAAAPEAKRLYTRPLNHSGNSCQLIRLDGHSVRISHHAAELNVGHPYDDTEDGVI